MNTCVTCKHYNEFGLSVGPQHLPAPLARCEHPNLTEPQQIDPVTGVWTELFLSCYYQRVYDGPDLCSREGKWWEAKTE